MNNAVWFISFKLIEDASTEDFLVASKKVHDEVLSKQKGFISWKVLRDGDTWVDLITWKTMEDAKNGEKAGGSNPIAHEFYAFIDFKTIKTKNYLVEKDY